MYAFMYVSLSITMNGCVHVHHLSVDDGGVLAAVRGCRVRVVGLSHHRLYGDELQGARGGVIWIWRTKREFTHKETTNTSNHYIVSQRRANCHTPSVSLSLSLITLPLYGWHCGIMSNISRRWQQIKCWTETIDHKDSVGFKRLCQCIFVIDERNWLCTFIRYPTSDKLDWILVSLNSADELFKSAH